MTLKDIEMLPSDVITVQQAARVLHMSPYDLRIKCRNGAVPFPVMLSGKDDRNVHIPKAGFIKFMTGE